MAAKRKASGRKAKSTGAARATRGGRAARNTGREAPGGNELLAMELREIHSAENQLSRVVPQLTKSVQSEKLRDLLEERLSQGEQIIADVETALEELEERPGRTRNVAAEGLIADAREHVRELDEGPALDSVLIGAIQKTEHYCIAAWGTAKALAKAVGHRSAAMQ
jgi:ferritin-like metal-binding protein YciE